MCMCKKQECVPGCIWKKKNSLKSTSNKCEFAFHFILFFFFNVFEWKAVAVFEEIRPSWWPLCHQHHLLAPATDILVCLFREAKAWGPSKMRHVHRIPGGLHPFLLRLRLLADKTDSWGNSCLVHPRVGMGNRIPRWCTSASVGSPRPASYDVLRYCGAIVTPPMCGSSHDPTGPDLALA